MPAQSTVSLAIPEARRSLARMFIDLTMAFHSTIFPLGQEPAELDADLVLVAVAVLLGHAEGHAMNASQIASHLHMPRSTVTARLRVLVERGLIVRIKDQYYLEPDRAANVPQRDKFELILSQGFAVLGPFLSKTDT
ncbi:hypothetical protein BRDID11004_59860 [Bradyrhizobium diazoefficiens]|uniref:HTH marR-type domain-containing protein n=2 Tax=Bradyrhizobium diazoefficiens TaxID=1355477 RepID=A0A810A183_9BRAD|nr:hypothetical protein F07S3_29480 [Bradyrhizobium diazoefficiens]BCA10866.1 hypothetical protein BDHF08_27130 [Bradyrhizobium diazoefficiens]BCE55201.1 hypothetical protein XF5B_27130 [Bradyrhizobium diazoefficiens]BCE63935.1 hypothetical protein XF6B_27340 [Bradyrhizobium diazoefficiens]